MEKSKEEIEKEIIKFLDENSTHKGNESKPGCGLEHGIACALATCKNNVPRATPIDFHNDGLTLWMIGDPGGKLGNIRSNPKVAVCIYTPLDHSKENRSIQLWGKASLITMRHQKELYMKIAKKFGILKAFERALRRGLYDLTCDEGFETAFNKLLHSETLIKVEPEKIALLIAHPSGKLEKLIWEKNG